MSAPSSRVDHEANQCLAQVSTTKRIRTAVFYIGALILGAGLGLVEQETLQTCLDFIATVFTRLFSLIAVPVIALSLLTTLVKLDRDSGSGRIFGHTVFYTLLTTVLAAGLAAVIFGLVAPENVVAPDGAQDVTEVTPATSYFEHMITVIPNNLLAPFVSGNVLSVLLIAAALGLGLAALPSSDGKRLLIGFFSGLQELLFVLIHALIKILPLGILAFTAQLVRQIEDGLILGGIAAYFGAVISANLIQMFVILPLILLLRRLNPLRIARAMLPALAVALFSKSSAGTLPVTMASAEDNCHVDPRVSRFVLPICTTINMNGCAAFILLTSLYLMQNAGIEITLGTTLAWILIATVAAVGNAGVPMGCFFLTLSLMSSMNVPVQLMGVILPVYAVIDMIETCLNVWSDSCVCNIVNRELVPTLPPAAA